MIKLCDYGCGQEASHQFKNGKFCCCSTYKSCPNIRIKKGISSLGRKAWNKGLTKDLDERVKLHTEKTGKTLKKLYDNKSLIVWNKNLKNCFSEESLKKIGEASKNRKGYWTGKIRGPMPKEIKDKISNSNKGHNVSEETKIKIGSKSKGRKLSDPVKKVMSEKKISSHKNPDSGYNKQEYRDKIRQRMLNGLAIEILKFQKNPSKPEILLRDLVKKIYNNCEFQFKILNYAVDIAIPKYKIAIEFDGYYHFKDLRTKEFTEYHIERETKIKNEGWEFIRYTIFDKFPTLEELKNKIEDFKNK